VALTSIWMAPWKNQICSTTMKLRKSLVKPVIRQNISSGLVLPPKIVMHDAFNVILWTSADICVIVHDDLGWKNRTTCCNRFWRDVRFFHGTIHFLYIHTGVAEHLFWLPQRVLLFTCDFHVTYGVPIIPVPVQLSHWHGHWPCCGIPVGRTTRPTSRTSSTHRVAARATLHRSGSWRARGGRSTRPRTWAISTWRPARWRRETSHRRWTSSPLGQSAYLASPTWCCHSWPLITDTSETWRMYQGSCAGLEFKACLERSLNLKKLKSPWIVLERVEGLEKFGICLSWKFPQDCGCDCANFLP